MKLTEISRYTCVVVLAWSPALVRAADEPQAAAAGSATGGVSAPSQDDPASELREHHRHLNSGGLTKFVAMSLDTLGTSDEAKGAEIGKLQSEIITHMAPAREAEKQLLQVLADGVAAGALDKAKVDAALSKLASAAASRNDADFDTLNQVHKVLSPAERTALVDKVQAHWQVWREVNPPGSRADEARLADLTREVSLTPDQVAKISAALKAAPASDAGTYDPNRGERRVKAFATTFVTEAFDAKSLASKEPVIAGRGSKRMAHFYEVVAPLLTPAQRTTVAEHLREYASYEPASGK